MLASNSSKAPWEKRLSFAVWNCRLRLCLWSLLYQKRSQSSPAPTDFFLKRREIQLFTFFKSFGVASQSRIPEGGEIRRNSRQATPAFFKLVTSCRDPNVAASSSSMFGAWPKQKTDSASLCFASSR